MSFLRSRVRAGDAGVTLVELLVVMVLLGVVSTMITSAYITTQRNVRHADDEAQGLSDVRKVVERLGRDVRAARSIAVGADANQLVLWIDYNSDYIQTMAETVTWELSASAEPGHYDVLRSVPGGAEYRQATTLVNDIAFNYSASADTSGSGIPLAMPLSADDTARVRIVTTEMTYDALLSGGSSERTVTFASRLRNVG
jgi:prepilin-type N-terminal cleavage/methylation domain-containing protein